MINQLLAIEPNFFNGINWSKMARFEPKAMPKVRLLNAENLYTSSELRYFFGIDTVAEKNGLVAVIPVTGMLTPNWEYYNGTSTKWLQAALKIADENVNVKAIVLDVDSGGGTVSGTEELALAVKNTKKPVIAFASSFACSAAYWTMANAREIFIGNDKMTCIGSIGTICTIYSYAEALAKAGIEAKVIRNPDDKALGQDSEPMNAQYVKEMEMLCAVATETFLGAVMAARPKVKADIGGGTFYGQAAIKAGLADKVGSLADAVKRADWLGRKGA